MIRVFVHNCGLSARRGLQALPGSFPTAKVWNAVPRSLAIIAILGLCSCKMPGFGNSSMENQALPEYESSVPNQGSGSREAYPAETKAYPAETSLASSAQSSSASFSESQNSHAVETIDSGLQPAQNQGTSQVSYEPQASVGSIPIPAGPTPKSLIEAGTPPATPTPSSVLRVHGVRPKSGPLRVAVFTDPSSFPNHDGAHSKLVLPVAQSSSVESALPVAPGTIVAVAVFQDLNDDGQLNRSSFGIPSEPYGFSRDALGKFGPPSFEDAALPADGSSAVELTLH